MKKFLALLLSVAMMLIPMSALAAEIETTIDYYENEVIIEAEFDASLAGKIATLVVLNPGKTLDDIIEPDLEVEPDPEAEPDFGAIAWADQVAIKAEGTGNDAVGIAEFVIDMTYAKTGEGYTFYVAVGDESVDSGFDYSVEDQKAFRDAALTEDVNDSSNATAINTFIVTTAKKDIPADIIEDYLDLDNTKPVQTALHKAIPFEDMDEFIEKLKAAVKAQAKKEQSSGSSSGSSSSSNSGYDFNISVDPQLIAPPAAVVTNPFADIPDGFWAKDAVLELYKKDIVAGQGENTFNPNATITRAEFVQMVVKAFGFGMKGDAPAFADVSDEWFAKAVNVAYTNGIVRGTTATTFAPANNITRQDMMVILTNAAKAAGKTLASTDRAFTDVAEISGYAQEAVSAMVGSGVVSGYTDGSVKPLANATRAEAAAMLNGLLNIK